MNLCNENWNWFYGKRTFIDEGVYIRFRGVYTHSSYLFCFHVILRFFVQVCNKVG